MKRKRIKLRYKKERVVFSDVLPYELPITFTNRFFYRFLVKNEVEYVINPLEHKKCKLRWKQGISIAARQVLAILFGIDSEKVMGEKKTVANVDNEPSIPFTYRIVHKRGKYRELAVIHPADQIKMVSFYEKYKSLILYYCQQSRFSLRHPHAVACYFYYRDRLHHTLLGKRSDDLELYFNEYENLKTYFSYKRYTQIYRFYEDYRYQRAEKKFAHLQKFDIQACFNSIYSHSIAWATNGGKATYKRFFKGEDGTFGAVWDSLMQKMNYNETNGIVIGPEFSRLFAEVILQYIDKCVENDLYEKGYKWNVDYECYRYVDDHFFFYNDREVLEVARRSYAYHLNEYKMTISNEKTEDIDRPFITPISRAKLAIDKLIHDTITINVDDELLKKDEMEDDAKDLAHETNMEDDADDDVVDMTRLKKSLETKHTLFFRSTFFSSAFQDILKTNNVEAKDVLNYTIARMGNSCERMLKKFDKLYKPLCLADKVSVLKTEMKDLREMKELAEKRKGIMEHELSLFLFNLLDSAFFIYSFNKQINSTLKLVNLLNTIIVYLDTDYMERTKDKKDKTLSKHKRFTDDIRANVFKKIQDEINVVFQCLHYSEDTQLETLYFLITLRSMRHKYHLSAASIENYIGVNVTKDGKKVLPDMNTLSITLFLYYFADRSEFDELRTLVVNKACERIANVPAELCKKTAEMVILLLDLMACPYLKLENKTKVGEAFGLTKKETKNLFRYFKNGRYMFTNWKKLNVTKELNAKISQEVYA